MKVCLVGHDVQPSEAFIRLKSALEKRGHTVDAYLGFGKGIQGAFLKSVEASDVTVIGMSSSSTLADAEIEAAYEAIRSDIPFGFYADSFGVSQRVWFEGARGRTEFVFVLSDPEIEPTQKLFINAQVCATGNPTHEGYADFNKSKADVLAALNIQPNDYIILVAGTKDFKINANTLVATMYAGVKRGSSWQQTPAIIYALHPGDQPIEVRKQQYSDLKGCMLIEVTIVDPGVMSGSDLLSASDILVNNATSLGIEAAYKRIPVIEYMTDRTRQMLLEGTGSREWPLIRMGAALKADDPYELAILLESASFDSLKKTQALAFPTPPAKGSAIQKMVETIESFK